MATGVISEEAIAARSIIDSCFAKLPYDGRFHSVSLQKFGCKTGIDKNVKQFEFVLPRLDPPNVYIFRDVLIQFDLILQKSDGSPIPTEKKVGPIADPIGGLIESLIVS